MRESKSIALAATVIALFLLMVAGNIQTAKAESAVSVEGEWEIISTNIDALKNHVGQRQSITRKGNGFEVKWLGSGNVETYTGSETRIVRTVLEDLGSPLSGDTPPEVLRQVKGQKVPINLSYTLSADGNYMQRECDYIHMFYRSQSKRFDHYEIAPGYIKWTLRRVSGPVKVEARGDRTAAVAQVESRGEFYVLTKDGRKLAGKDANQIPLEKGTKVITGNSGHVRMKLPDDTTFTIGPNSDIVIDSFVYDTDNTPKKVVANMTKGVFRWVTGKTKAVQDAEMKVKLPIMAVGIRGTDFEASVKPDNSGSVVLHFGQLEITENKTGFRFIMDAGYKVTFNADGSVSRPMKVE